MDKEQVRKIEEMEELERDEEVLRAKINCETALMPWKELERFFASGQLVAVSDSLDLVDVALQMAKDAHQQIEAWIRSGQINKVTDEQALDWHERDVELWAAVIKPWILVQEKAALN